MAQRLQLLTDCTVATMTPGATPYGLVPDASVLLDGGTIAWVGPAADAPDTAGAETVALGGRLVTPGLVDCHTHVIWGGSRAREFELRLTGASYEEIARAGGGILSTVEATRAADEDTLLAAALPRVDALLAEGVTTLEIKSGYGLERDTETRMLRVARRIGELRDVTVRTSYLGAHAVPAGSDADAYLDSVCLPTLTACAEAGLVDAVDGFCEGIAFSVAQMERVFDHARDLGLPIKLHAEQLSDLGGAVMAAGRGALSVDHIEYLSPGDAPALARAGTVAVLLPGAFYTLRETQAPPMEALRAAGVDMAVATDANPGSSPMTSLLLAMNMACTLFRMTPEEALAGTTRNAARALGLSDRGQVATGLRADLAVWDAAEPAELAYRIGYNPLHRAMTEGNWR